MVVCGAKITMAGGQGPGVSTCLNPWTARWCFEPSFVSAVGCDTLSEKRRNWYKGHRGLRHHSEPVKSGGSK